MIHWLKNFFKRKNRGPICFCGRPSFEHFSGVRMKMFCNCYGYAEKS